MISPSVWTSSATEMSSPSIYSSSSSASSIDKTDDDVFPRSSTPSPEPSWLGFSTQVRSPPMQQCPQSSRPANPVTGNPKRPAASVSTFSLAHHHRRLHQLHRLHRFHMNGMPSNFVHPLRAVKRLLQHLSRLPGTGYQRRWLRRNLSPTTKAPPPPLPPPRLVVETDHFGTGLFREDFSHPQALFDRDVVL
jgi:hypothetical protein